MEPDDVATDLHRPHGEGQPDVADADVALIDVITALAAGAVPLAPARPSYR